jgi:hypothetical protein
VDIAGCSGVELAVTLNGERIHLSEFEEYVKLFQRQPSTEESTMAASSLLPPILYCKLNSRWGVAVSLKKCEADKDLVRDSHPNSDSLREKGIRSWESPGETDRTTACILCMDHFHCHTAGKKYQSSPSELTMLIYRA